MRRRCLALDIPPILNTYGGLREIRTPDPWNRNPMLYPAELRVRARAINRLEITVTVRTLSCDFVPLVMRGGSMHCHCMRTNAISIVGKRFRQNRTGERYRGTAGV